MVISAVRVNLDICQVRENRCKRLPAAQIYSYEILTSWQIHDTEKRQVVSEGLDIEQVRRKA